MDILLSGDHKIFIGRENILENNTTIIMRISFMKHYIIYEFNYADGGMEM